MIMDVSFILLTSLFVIQVNGVSIAESRHLSKNTILIHAAFQLMHYSNWNTRSLTLMMC